MRGNFLKYLTFYKSEFYIESAHQSVKNVAIREEFKTLEVRFNAARDDMYTANAKIKLLKCEKNKFDAVRIL